ncbi:hypothetical protein C2845_PM11G28680 [Panicum miliaceum]|uniref:Uncharacterized protein n=1 Tax=Panicum miliaceum TaxID=4540 RepID=A0A3L6RRR2_PANMI|nr:hypothetical protein C2845_PM11G28680 [Panicum miliaceum]
MIKMGSNTLQNPVLAIPLTNQPPPLALFAERTRLTIPSRAPRVQIPELLRPPPARPPAAALRPLVAMGLRRLRARLLRPPATALRPSPARRHGAPPRLRRPRPLAPPHPVRPRRKARAATAAEATQSMESAPPALFGVAACCGCSCTYCCGGGGGCWPGGGWF